MIDEYSSIAENAIFLVRWAAELFVDWATWINFVIPGCDISYKSNIQQIVGEIEEMWKDRRVVSVQDGWKQINDMLHSSLICNGAVEVLNALAILSNN